MASSLAEKRLRKRRGSQPQRGQVNAEQSLKAPAAPRQVPSHSKCLQLLLKSPATGLNISCKIQAKWESADKTRCSTGLQVLAEMDTLGDTVMQCLSPREQMFTVVEPHQMILE